MKGILKKLMQIGFAGALSLLAFAPSAVRAAGESVSVTIPVSTEFTQDSDEPAPSIQLTTNFLLEPLDGAPAPAAGQVSIEGAGKSGLGPVTFTQPGNYYYQLSASLANGENNSDLNEKLIVRVTVVNDEKGGLSSVVTAYNSQSDASSDNGKVDTAFFIEYKAPKKPTASTTAQGPKKAAKTKTSVYAQPGLWILLGGAALLILIGAGKRSKAR
ncbi:hypothetical protein [Faecalibaculum rodentium]|uniref:hypothetical protein n=1 Tax=Faecalibaculum rodentium TaxID=1702221 RepID=UPI00259B070F|nr:hypothetical protein [Faecalibaculum rodentium]